MSTASRRRWWDGQAPVVATVDCQGARHRIIWRRGRLVLEDHNLAGERVLEALGGEPSVCLTILDAWRHAGRRHQGAPPRQPGPVATIAPSPSSIGATRAVVRAVASARVSAVSSSTAPRPASGPPAPRNPPPGARVVSFIGPGSSTPTLTDLRRQLMAQLTHLLNPADKPRIVTAQIARRLLGQPLLNQRVMHTLPECGDPFPDLSLLQRLHSLREPRLQVLQLCALQLVLAAPRSDLGVVGFLAAQPDEIHPRHRIPTPNPLGLHAGELLELPAAVLALQIIG